MATTSRRPCRRGQKFTTPLRPNDPEPSDPAERGVHASPVAVGRRGGECDSPADAARPPATGQGNDQVHYDSPSSDRTVPIVFAVVAFLMVGGLTGEASIAGIGENLPRRANS